jgi:hypothetical protein
MFGVVLQPTVRTGRCTSFSLDGRWKSNMEAGLLTVKLPMPSPTVRRDPFR